MFCKKSAAAQEIISGITAEDRKINNTIESSSGNPKATETDVEEDNDDMPEIMQIIVDKDDCLQWQTK
eukprot:15338603-Ditylum_brightwellii.AAC.3